MNHSHRTRDSHAQFFQQNNIEHPLRFLHRCCLRILAGHSAKLGLRPQTDVLHTLKLQGTQSMLEQIEHLIAGGPDQTVAPAAFECRTCGVMFSSIQALLVHEDRLHGMKHPRIQVFSAVRDADEGTSICRHCNHSFPTWNALRTHIEHASCSQFDPLQVMSTSLANAWSSLLPQILEIDPAGLSLNPCIGDYLRSHCILCGTQCLRFQDMTHHLALEHSSLASQATGLYQHWHGSMLSPCTFCHVDFAHTHHCKVLFQLMVLRTESMLNEGASTCSRTASSLAGTGSSHKRSSIDDPAGTTAPDVCMNTYPVDEGTGQNIEVVEKEMSYSPTAMEQEAPASLHEQVEHRPRSHSKSPEDPFPQVCIICAGSFATTALLAEHMGTHDTYHLVRDAVQGQPTCAHCRSSFREIWELQRHIVRRSCPVFDPRLQPTGALRSDPELQAALRAGRVVEMLQNPQHPVERLRFTLSCSMCGTGLSRVADLTRHLQTQHGPFYRSADAMFFCWRSNNRTVYAILDGLLNPDLTGALLGVRLQ